MLYVFKQVLKILRRRKVRKHLRMRLFLKKRRLQSKSLVLLFNVVKSDTPFNKFPHNAWRGE